MPFTSIIPTNPRTNPWNYHKFFLRIGKFENRPFWKIGHFGFFFLANFFFCLISMKISHKSSGRIDGTQFWCLPWFPANSLLCVIYRYTVYVFNKIHSVELGLLNYPSFVFVALIVTEIFRKPLKYYYGHCISVETKVVTK